jgi:outer membrane protein TolC
MRPVRLLSSLLAVGLLLGAEPAQTTLPAPSKEKAKGVELPAPPPSLLDDATNPIDLGAALKLAGVQNPEILLARERVEEASAAQMLAAAQLLPSLNAGGNVDTHTGPLQRSTGIITDLHRGSLYLGLGASAVGTGTVTIPGIVWSGNVSVALFGRLVARQVTRSREFASVAVRNETLLRVARAYLDLLRAQGRLAIALQVRDEARNLARVTANFARAGQGRQADAERAATELEFRTGDVVQFEGDILIASARLCQLLDLDPSTRLRVIDGHVVPSPIVPNPIPLCELLTIAVTQRPELGERRELVRAALLELHGAKVLPFSPNVVLGYSAGDFGGGSDLVAKGIAQPDGTVLRQSRFGNYAGRQDFDAVVYWTLRNLGVGNLALIRLAKSNVRSEELRNIEVLDRVRAEVASAYAATHARYAQIDTGARAIVSGKNAFTEDLERTRNNEGLPIEVLDSFRLLARSRYAYLDAIIDYNRAQFELYVALGQPPADCLARPVPVSPTVTLVPATLPEPKPLPALPKPSE